MPKAFLQYIEVVLSEKRLEETANIGKMRPFWELEKMATKEGYSLCKIITLGQKKKIAKNISKTNLHAHFTNSIKKKRSKNSYLFQKWDHFENWQKWPPNKGCRLHFGSKIRSVKKHSKNVSTIHCSCCVQETARKKIVFFLKMRAFWKLANSPTKQRLYSLCKIVTLGQKLKVQNNMVKFFLPDIVSVLCNQRLVETANIRNMRLFWKLAKVATKQRL